MYVAQRGIIALQEGAQEVQGRGRLAISLQLALRIGNARFRREFGAVDDVAAVGRQRHVALLLDVRGAGFGELAGDTAHLDDR